MPVEPTRARFTERPGYESYYLVARHPSEPRAVWIRYTVLVHPYQAPAAAVWCTLFEGGDVRAVRVANLTPSLPPDAWLAAGDSSIGHGRARGTANNPADEHAAAWDLRFDLEAPPLFHLPQAWMYRAPLPRTKSISLAPLTSFTGSLRFDDLALKIDGWPGMVGHNWGAEHAARWIWLHGTGFEGAPPGSWLDVVLGRIEVAGRMTPWIASGAIAIGARRVRLGGPARARRTLVRERPDGAELMLPGASGLMARVEVTSSAIAAWRYGDPGGGEHHVYNSSVAGMTVQVGGDRWTSAAGAVYELGTRDPAPDIESLPFGPEA